MSFVAGSKARVACRAKETNIIARIAIGKEGLTQNRVLKDSIFDSRWVNYQIQRRLLNTVFDSGCFFHKTRFDTNIHLFGVMVKLPNGNFEKIILLGSLFTEGVG